MEIKQFREKKAEALRKVELADHVFHVQESPFSIVISIGNKSHDLVLRHSFQCS